MRTTTLLTAAMLMTVFAVAPAASAVSGDYIAAGGDLVVSCHAEAELGACVGGQIFDVPSGSSSVDVAIEDDNVASTGGFYQFVNETGGVEDFGGFCGSTSAAVPSSAVTLEVFVDTGFGPLDCPESPPGIGTTGTIFASWS